MTNMIRKSRNAVNRRLRLYRQRNSERRGLIGNLITGEVDVPGKPGVIYVTSMTGIITEVVNRRVPSLYQSYVNYGIDPQDMPNTVQVLSTCDIYDQTLLTDTNRLGNHHWQHEYPNSDTVYVWSEQLLSSGFFPVAADPLDPDAKLQVLIYPGKYRISSGWLVVELTTTIDLTPYRPTEAGKAKFVMIVVDTTGNFTVRDGEIVSAAPPLTAWQSLAEANIPEPVVGDNCIVACKLYTGQLVLRKDDQNDFVDLRGVGGMVGAGGNVTPSVPTTFSITEDLTSQITGATAHFTLLGIALDQIAVYCNLRQAPGDVTIDADRLGFTLSYTPTTADRLVVDYTTDSINYIYDDMGSRIYDDLGNSLVEA